ncbi:MAG: hypothetical protein AAGF87_05685 [Bacteroidota bacterium]
MKNALYLGLLAIALFASACGNDDDGGDTPMNFLPNENDLLIKLNWTTADAEFDLIEVLAPGGVVMDSEGFDTGTIANVVFSGDDADSPGEESIRFNDSAPDGSYTVFYDTGFTEDDDESYMATLEITSQGTSQTFTNSIDSEGEVEINFTKTGGRLTFQ